MCTKPFSQTKNKGKLFLVAKSSGPLLARMPLKLLPVATQQTFQCKYAFLTDTYAPTWLFSSVDHEIPLLK